MGNTGSSIGNEQYKSNAKTFTPSMTELPFDMNIDELRNNLKKLLEYHDNVKKVFIMAESRVNTGFSFPIMSKENPLEQFASASLDDPQEKAILMSLFQLGVLKVKVKDNTDFKIVIHPSFKKIHNQLIVNIKSLIDTSVPVQSEFSFNTVSDASIKAEYENNLKTLNNIVSRIMVFKYNIIMNNYIVHLYTIYAQAQLEVFEAELVKSKKQKEFTTLQKVFSDSLRQNQESKSRLNIDENLNKLHSTMRSNYKALGGSYNLNATSEYIVRIQDLLAKYKSMYDASNQQTQEFFDMINNLIDVKTNELITQYTAASESTIINKNIINALLNLESQIKNSELAYYPNSDIQSLVDNFSLTQEQRQSLLKYLQILTLQNNASNFSSQMDTFGMNTSLNAPLSAPSNMGMNRGNFGAFNSV